MEAIPNLSVSYLFSRAWERMRSHLGPTVAVFFVYVIATNLTSTVIRDDGGFDFFAKVIEFVVRGPMTVGALWFGLNLVRGEEANIGALFEGFRKFGTSFLVYLVYVLAICIGFVLLIIPGIIAAIGFGPSLLLVMDEDLTVGDHLRKAWDMTRGYKGQLFVVGMAALGVNILGFLALGVGIFFTGALTLVVEALVYEELKAAYDQS